MTHTYTISLHALHGFTVLPRLALLFSRRRLKLERLEMTDAEQTGIAHFHIVLHCDGTTVEKIIKQMQRIVEVMDVTIGEGRINHIPSAKKAVGKPALAMA